MALLCACLPTYLPLFRRRTQPASYQLSDYESGGTADGKPRTRKSNGQHGSSMGHSAMEPEEDTYPMWVKTGVAHDNALSKAPTNMPHDIQITTRVEQKVADVEEGDHSVMQRM